MFPSYVYLLAEPYHPSPNIMWLLIRAQQKPNLDIKTSDSNINNNNHCFSNTTLVYTNDCNVNSTNGHCSSNKFDIGTKGFNANNGNAPLNPIFIDANDKPCRFPPILLIQLF